MLKKTITIVFKNICAILGFIWTFKNVEDDSRHFDFKNSPRSEKSSKAAFTILFGEIKINPTLSIEKIRKNLRYSKAFKNIYIFNMKKQSK